MANVIENYNGGVQFKTGASQGLTVDIDGNIGVGTTPSAWYNSYRAFQINNTSLTNQSNVVTRLATNYYIDSSGVQKNITTDYATQYIQASGVHTWSTAASAVAGSAVTWKDNMVLDASGNLGLGIIPDAGGLSGKILSMQSYNLQSDVNSHYQINNAYHNGTNWIGKYSSKYATMYAQDSALGKHRWYIAGATAGATVPWTNVMDLDYNGNMGVSGNLGAGTTSPLYKLQIADTSGGMFFEGTNTTYNRLKSTTTNLSVGKDLLIATNSAGDTGLYVNTGGNIGVGTTTPSAKFEVQSDLSPEIAITSTSGATSNYLNFKAKSHTQPIQAQIKTSDNGNFTADIVFSSKASTTSGVLSEKMRLNASGNLGINVTPGSWSSTRRSIDIGGTASTSYGSINSDGLDVNIMHNTYHNGTNYIRVAALPVTRAGQYNGAFTWSSAATGTAGSTVTLTDKMVLDVNGNLTVTGTISSNGVTIGTLAEFTAALG